MDIYVIVAPQKSAQFNEALETISKKHGLSPRVGQATDDRGRTIRVIEANGRLVRLWSQNVPRSGRENTAFCGSQPEPYPDPSQYMVTVRPIFPFFFGGTTAVAVLAAISKDLRQAGYDVQSKPSECGVGPEAFERASLWGSGVS